MEEWLQKQRLVWPPVKEDDDSACTVYCSDLQASVSRLGWFVGNDSVLGVLLFHKKWWIDRRKRTMILFWVCFIEARKAMARQKKTKWARILMTFPSISVRQKTVLWRKVLWEICTWMEFISLSACHLLIWLKIWKNINRVLFEIISLIIWRKEDFLLPGKDMHWPPVSSTSKYLSGGRVKIDTVFTFESRQESKPL